MKNGDRVIDGLKAAGGMTKNADQREVNLAQRLRDEMEIYVPKKGETLRLGAAEVQQPGSEADNSGNQNKVSINQASEAQLETIPGIGPSKAKAIIDYRNKHSRFKALTELKNISGIGDKTFEKLKDHITL